MHQNPEEVSTDTQAFLRALCPGDIIPARVKNTAPVGVFCDIGQGCTALMRLNRCRISRLRHSCEGFQRGDAIFAAVLSVDLSSRRIYLSGREVLGTWEENTEHFRQGQTVTGTVRTVQSYGIFVELMPNLCGLAEYRTGIKPGDWVRVSIRAILPGKHKVKLDILEVLPQHTPRKEPEYFITSGHINRWEYFPGSPAFTVF